MLRSVLRCHADADQQILITDKANMHRDTLDLNHKLNNPLFASWKLSRALSVSEQTVTLNGRVSTSEHNTDYLNTRAAVLHNHINHQHGRLYVFCISAESLSLQEICQSQATVLKTVWGMCPVHIAIWICSGNSIRPDTMCRAFTSYTDSKFKHKT